MTKRFKRWMVLFLFAAVPIWTSPGDCQEDDFGFGQSPGKQEQLQDPLSNPFQEFGVKNEASAEFESSFTVNKGRSWGVLTITGMPDVLSHSHLYSQRTDLEYQEPTVFKVQGHPAVKVTGKFVPDVEPEFVEKDVAGTIWKTEEFAGDVTWSAPIEFVAGTDVEKVEIAIRIEGQVCNEGGCLTFENLVTKAKFDGYVSAGPFRAAKRTASDKVQWTGTVSASTVKPGGKFTFALTAKLDEKWHIYGVEPTTKEKDPTNPTLIVFSNPGNLKPGEVVASEKATEKTAGDFQQFYHEGTVSFVTEFEVPRDSVQGSVLVNGKLGFQACDERGICKMPTVADFQFTVNVASEADLTPGEVILSTSTADYDSLVEMANRTREKNQQEAGIPREPFNLSTFLWYCGLSFLAGLILNVMPCVLPVIGLKMMSFVEQSGEDKRRIFSLNISFSLGLMTVFWFLAFLVIVLNFGWGEMLNNLVGVIIASGVVFAFGLSMIGVWEIPIPGFASSTAASKLAEKEGLGGAYIKGILTTILATPCVGPMLIPAMTFAVTQTQIVAFALFTVLGLGMASPFVMVAFFPGAIKLLPKPGAWMETFKQLMGFILIATVIFLMNTFSQKGDQVAWLMSVLTMLLAIGIGCWWIGRTSIAAELRDKVKAYAVGLAIIGGGSFLGFHYLGPSEFELDWKMYSDQQLVESKQAGAAIFIDFTGPG